MCGFVVHGSWLMVHGALSKSPRRGDLGKQMDLFKSSRLRVQGSRFQDSGFKKFKEFKSNFLFFTFNFVDFCHDSAIQASLIALTAPKVHSSLFTFHSLRSPLGGSGAFSFFIDLWSSLLTLGIVQASLTLLSLNRSLLHSF